MKAPSDMQQNTQQKTQQNIKGGSKWRLREKYVFSVAIFGLVYSPPLVFCCLCYICFKVLFLSGGAVRAGGSIMIQDRWRLTDPAFTAHLGLSMFQKSARAGTVRAQNVKNAAYRGPVCYHPLLAYCHRDPECADRVLSCAAAVDITIKLVSQSVTVICARCVRFPLL